MTDRTSRRAIVYSRVSTTHQAEDGHGLDAQAAQGAAYCVAKGWPLPPEHVEDAGVSGSVPPAKRPGLGAALERLDAGEADVLVTASLSRLGRDAYEVLGLVRRAQAGGWGLAVIDVSLDTTTPTGKAMFGMLAVMAELERDQAIERTNQGIAAAKAKGVRFGRKLSAATRKAGARAIELRAGGATYQQIADTLGAEGLATAGGASTWTAQQARRAMLSVRQDQDAAAKRRANGAPAS